MKKLISGLLLCLLCKAAVFSSPVYPRQHQVVQPDGSSITLVGHGDEFCHYTTTADGYTIMLADDGFYHYATEFGGKLMTTLQRAHDLELRTQAEAGFVAGMTKYLHPEVTSTARHLQSRQQALAQRPLSLTHLSAPRRAAAEEEEPEAQPIYRGLVLLIDFNDRKFSHGDETTQEYYKSLFNKRNFTSYWDKFYGHQSYTGSVRDYFYDQSDGQFDPEFDVIGPVTIDHSQYDIDAYVNTALLTQEILAQVDDEVDFARYDSDGDGDVDMIYIIYAGYSSSYEGNDARLVWPHASTMIDPEGEDPDICHDGVRMARYACSAEIFGWESDGDKLLDGIGTICHEFSHVLGFMDHYDVLGYQEHPNTWDIMAAGSYNGYFNRTPCGYNSYEKAVAGFISPRDISQLDGETVTLHSSETTHEAAIIYSMQEHVSFFMDNRQPDKWDKCLPGHGLLVWRVDSIVPEYWTHNYVNVTTRACFRLVRACGTQGNILSGVEDTDFDPFPGTRHVTSLDNEPGASNLQSYDRYPSPVVLQDIAEEEGVITFRVEKDSLADASPINYDIAEEFVAVGERLVGEEWVPVSWTVTSGQAKINNVDNWVIFNPLPNEIGIESTTRDYSNGVFVYYGYNVDAVSGYITAQRVSLTDDYGIWICDFTDVSQQGSGSIQFTVSRHGIPALVNPEAEIGWCAMKKTAAMVSESKMISRLDVYRNIHFYEPGQVPTDGIEQIQNDESEAYGLKSIYDLQGQRVTIQDKGFYIANGKKILLR